MKLQCSSSILYGINNLQLAIVGKKFLISTYDFLPDHLHSELVRYDLNTNA
jgi:hypothetical protein